MNILVTGSSGLIGSALVDALAAGGHTVVRLVRGGGRPAHSMVADVNWDPASGQLDLATLEAAGPYDGVVHLAGAGIGDRRWTPARRIELMESRTRSTSLLVEALVALDPRPPVLVSASAVGFYGDRGVEELTEHSEAGSGFLADICQAWEAAAAPAAEAGIRTVLLRTGIVLAASGGALGKQLPLFRLGLGGPIGSGLQYRSWITLSDEVRVILHCLTEPSLSGPVNATAPAPATDRALAKALGAALHRPAALPVPSLALKAVLGSDMATEMVLSSQRVLPERLMASGFTFDHPSLDEAVVSVLARS
jgi:hypothetical protein